jgi:hypothetical protein
MSSLTTQSASSSSPPSLSNPEARMLHYSEHALPTSLMDLRNKHGFVNKVIQYCETAYLTEDQDKADITAQTQEYLVDALGAVSKDIEIICANLTGFLDLQCDAISSLGPEIDLVKSRIALTKASHAQGLLVNDRRSGTNVPVERKQKMEALEGEKSVVAMAGFKREALSERLKRLDSVGNSKV